MSDLDQKPPAKKARTGGADDVAEGTSSTVEREDETEGALFSRNKPRAPRCVVLRDRPHLNPSCDLDSFRIKPPGSFEKEGLIGMCSESQSYAYECNAKHSDLLESLARAVFAGRLDIIRRVFEDKELSTMASSEVWHAEKPPCIKLSLIRKPIPADGSCCQVRFRTCCKPADVKVFHALNGRFGNSKAGGMYVPLLIHACELGHFDIVKYLIEQGADINVWCGRDQSEYSSDNRGFDDRTPLAAACRSGFEDIALYLIEKGAILTPQETKVTKTRSSRVSKWYGNDIYMDTPLTWAVRHGMFDTVHALIEHGVFLAEKALPTVDHATGRKLKVRFDSKAHERKVEMLVSWSSRAAIVETWDRIINLLGSPDVEDAGYFVKGRMLETLGQSGLSLFGLFEKVCEDIKEKSEEEPSSFPMRHPSVWRPHTSDGVLRPHVISLIRGCKYVRWPRSGYEMSRLDHKHARHAHMVYFLKLGNSSGKRRAWEKLVLDVRNWQTEGDEAWRKPLKDIILLAAQPWSRANHHLFPEVAREKAHELMLVGSKLERSFNCTGKLIDVWESNVLPYLVG